MRHVTEPGTLITIAVRVTTPQANITPNKEAGKAKGMKEAKKMEWTDGWTRVFPHGTMIRQETSKNTSKNHEATVLANALTVSAKSEESAFVSVPCARVNPNAFPTVIDPPVVSKLTRPHRSDNNTDTTPISQQKS